MSNALPASAVLPQGVARTGDAIAVITAALSFFKTIPWPEIAAFLAAVYTLLRILDFIYQAFQNSVLKNKKLS